MSHQIHVLSAGEDYKSCDCRKHHHVSVDTAYQWTSRRKPIRLAEWVGPKHIRMLTASWKIVRSGYQGLGYTQMVMEQ